MLQFLEKTQKEKSARSLTGDGRSGALTNTGQDAAPANKAALVRGKRGVAQGLGALFLKPWQEAMRPASPVFQHAERPFPVGEHALSKCYLDQKIDS